MCINIGSLQKMELFWDTNSLVRATARANNSEIRAGKKGY